MKIILDIPDDIVDDLKERNIRVFAGMDLIAERIRSDEWKIKIKGCSMCGECCKHLTRGHPFPIIKGQCIYLMNPPGHGEKWICGLGINRPFGCAVANVTAGYCKVRYEYLSKDKGRKQNEDKVL